MNYHIIPATPKHFAAIQKIYAYYVEQTAISFEYTAPSEATLLMRYKALMAQSFPYFVAVNNTTQEVIGFAYASPYSERMAYQYCCTLSLYLDVAQRSQGIGQALYNRLEHALIERGMVQLLSIVTHDNEASLNFHHRNGFSEIGRFPHSGYKFNRWYDTLWLSKTVNAHKIT